MEKVQTDILLSYDGSLILHKCGFDIATTFMLNERCIANLMYTRNQALRGSS